MEQLPISSSPNALAHDLQGLLAAIMMYAEKMQKSTNSAPQLKDLAEKIVKKTETASRMVRSQLNTYTGLRLQLIEQDLNPLVNAAAGMFEDLSCYQNVSISLQLRKGLPSVMIDSDSMFRVLENLIKNAAQAFNPNMLNSKIELRTGLSSEGHPYIEVADNGPGIPAEDQRNLFDSHFTTKEDGHGLGLAICHEIVTAHGGSLAVASIVGMGTTFRISIPSVDVKPFPSETKLLFTNTLKGSHLAVVDDDESVRELIVEQIEELGHRVQGFGTAQELLCALQNTPVDLILLDVNLPDMKGTDLYEQISKMKPVPNVLFVTGDNQAPNIKLFLKNTGTRSLSKPFHITDLCSEIEFALSQNVEQKVA